MEVVCGEALGGTSAINCMFYTRGKSTVGARRFKRVLNAVDLRRPRGGLQPVEGARERRVGIRGPRAVLCEVGDDSFPPKVAVPRKERSVSHPLHR